MTVEPPDRVPAATIAGLALAAAAMVGSVVTPAMVNPTVLYPASVALVGYGSGRRWLWPLVMVLALVGWAGLGASALASEPLPWVNRTLGVLSAVVVAGAVHRWSRDRDALAESRRGLEAHTARLEETNSELAAREEEIARQNEELQSQTEELERQSEELRIANEELAARERMLAQLLDVARTLSSEIHSPDVMATICEALTELFDESPAASTMLLREEDALRVRCHHGFGRDGPAAPELPYEHSFASLVVSRGQTGFLPDLALRPDVMVPEPASGPPFRSVLAAPIWLRGQAVGSLEVYTREPQQWSEEQIALITSMAAQASISLETARLFEELDREKRRFETVFRTLPVGVLVCTDTECREVMGNPAAAALFNTAVDANFSPFARPPALVRRTELRGGRAVALEEQALVQAVRQGVEVEGEEVEILLTSGRRYTVLQSAVPIYDAQGRPAGGVAVFADITARKHLERELEVRRREAEEASVRKTRFLSAVSHDIRTPANAIRLRAELIKRTASNPALAARIPELANDLQASAVAMVELVGEVLDLTRFDTGRVELQESEFSLGDILREECTHLQPVAEAKRLALTCSAVDPPIVVRTDRVKLARVIGNLLENALKFTPTGTVEASAAVVLDGAVEIRIRDTGPGIPPEHLEQVFDEFFQLRNPERDRTKGRGLGLAICKRLVEAMGGTIRAETNAGGGSTFGVRLPPDTVVPHAVPTGTRYVPPPLPARALDGLRVLVVEDHASTRADIVELLRSEGAIVAHAGDGHTALRLVRQAAPQVLLLDLMLPDLDGAEVLRHIRAARPPALQHVFVLTGDGAARDGQELRGLGADDVIAKPIDPPALLARLCGLYAGAAET